MNWLASIDHGRSIHSRHPIGDASLQRLSSLKARISQDVDLTVLVKIQTESLLLIYVCLVQCEIKSQVTVHFDCRMELACGQ